MSPSGNTADAAIDRLNHPHRISETDQPTCTPSDDSHRRSHTAPRSKSRQTGGSQRSDVARPWLSSRSTASRPSRMLIFAKLSTISPVQSVNDVPGSYHSRFSIFNGLKQELGRYLDRGSQGSVD